MPVTHEHKDAYEQAKAALGVIEKALTDAGAKPGDVVRTVVYLRDAADADAVAKAHLEIFDSVRPASTLVQVTSMLRGWQRVEIEAYAKLPSPGLTTCADNAMRSRSLCWRLLAGESDWSRHLRGFGSPSAPRPRCLPIG